MKKRNEEQYYEPIKSCLTIVMSKYLNAEPYQLQSSLISEDTPKRVYFEIIGGRNVFSENLKKVFDDDTLNTIRLEGIYPDLVGYVQKCSQGSKEIVIAEIKDEPITLKMIGKTKFYKDVFNAKFAFLISTHVLSEEKVRILLKKPSIGQGVIIAKFIPTPQFNAGYIEINSRFKEIVPDFVHFWLRPKVTDPESKPKQSFFNRILK